MPMTASRMTRVDQAAQEAAVELHVGIIEQQRRLAQPGDHAPGADADVDGVHKSAEDDDGGGAESHGSHGDQCATAIPEDVADREL